MKENIKDFFSLVQEFRERSYDEKYKSICEKEKSNEKVEKYINSKVKSSNRWERVVTIAFPVIIAVVSVLVKTDPDATKFVLRHLDCFVLVVLLILFLISFGITGHKVSRWAGISEAQNRNHLNLKQKEAELHKNINWQYNEIIKKWKSFDVKTACINIEVGLMQEFAKELDQLCSIAIYCKEDEKIKMLDYYGPRVEHLEALPRMYNVGEISTTDSRFRDYFCVKTLLGEEKSNIGNGIIFFAEKKEVIKHLNLQENTPFSQYVNFLMKLNEKDTILLEIIVYNDHKLKEAELKAVLLEYAKVIYTVFNSLVTNFFDGGSHEGK